MKTRSKTQVLVEGALMIALATVLSYIKLFSLPQGGAITLEMIPLVLMGLRNGTKWGCFTGFVHGLLQMMLGFENVLYCQTLAAQVGCILLDYLLAFTVLGLAPLVADRFQNRMLGAALGAVLCGALRFLCSFLSVWLLWGSYAPEGMAAPVYSLVYNGSYMLPNTVIMAVVVTLLYQASPKLFHAAPLARTSSAAEEAPISAVQQRSAAAAAAAVLAGVGGKDNLTKADYCATRLRFEVKDSSLVDDKALKAAGVSGVIRPSESSCQVVIGTKAHAVYDELKKLL